MGRAIEPNIGLRPSGPDDRGFLIALYASTRAEELAAVGWTVAEKSEFIRMQFELQDAHYRRFFPDAERSLIVRGSRPIGRMIVDRNKDEVHIIDISIVPEFRGRGIGSTLLRDVMAEADESGRPVRIYVEVFNRARRLYERLGFRFLESIGVHHLMEYRT